MSALLKILESHEFEIDQEDGNHICTCGTWKEADCMGTYEAYLAHVAQVLDQHMRLREEQAKADALAEYADAIQHVDDVIQREAEADDRWTDFQDAERDFIRNDVDVSRDYYTATTHYARYLANRYKAQQ